jgi:hypothetical protein
MASVLIVVLLAPGKCGRGEISTRRCAQILSGFGGSTSRRKAPALSQKKKRLNHGFDTKIARFLVCLRRSLSPTSLRRLLGYNLLSFLSSPRSIPPDYGDLPVLENTLPL